MKNRRKLMQIMIFLKNINFLCLIIICTIVFVIFLTITNLFFASPHEFGDSAGAVNGLFSALAFAGVIYAILLQKKELGLQRKELKYTRQELKEQKNEFILQNETLRHQRFENTFFQMLTLQQEIVSGLNHFYRGVNGTVETVSRSMFGDLFLYVQVYHNNTTYLSLKELLNKCGITPYCSLNLPEHFDHYFRHLYRIIKFVDETDFLSEDEKYSYTSMLRATLSRYELVWLFYNSLSPNGENKFKPLIEKYALLKNLRKDLLANKDYCGYYANGAYEKIITNA